MKRQLTKLVLVALLISFSLSFMPTSSLASYSRDEPESSKQMAFHDAMRKLWEDHYRETGPEM
jgi:hypothetical protein